MLAVAAQPSMPYLGRDMKYREYNPHDLLQDSVKCFWINEANYLSESKQDITPDGCIELIFNFGSPYLLLTTTPPTPLPAAIIVGFQNKTLPRHPARNSAWS